MQDSYAFLKQVCTFSKLATAPFSTVAAYNLISSSITKQHSISFVAFSEEANFIDGLEIVLQLVEGTR